MMPRQLLLRANRSFPKQIAVVALLFCAVIASGAADAGDVEQGRNEAYRQAVLDAERELLEQNALTTDGTGWNVSAFLSIVALAAAVGLTAWLTRRLRKQGWSAASGREMRVVDRLSLSRQSALFIVQIGNKRYWLAEHHKGVTMLGECPEELGASGAPPHADRSQPPTKP